MWQKRQLWLGVGAALVLLIGAYIFTRAPAVEITRPVRGPAVEAVYATGTVEPVNHAELASKITGRVTEVRAQEGARVAPGDVLAVIDDREDASTVAQLTAQLTLAENDLARSRSLRTSGHISQAALDKAVSARNSARGLLDAAQARLNEHYIKSPMAGQVMRLPGQIKPGDMAQIGQVLFVVGDPSALRIEAEVDEEDIPRIKRGQEALLRADAFAATDLKGSVAEMTPFGDPIKRTYRIYIALPAGTPLLSGMTTEINIVINRRTDALLVPSTSVAGNSVWVVEGRRARLLKADVGTIGKDRAEIRSGIAADAQVIVNPAGLKEGDRVRTTEVEPN